jgi:hypothetical protein
MSDLLVVRRSPRLPDGSASSAHHLVDRLTGHAVQPAMAITRAAVVPPRGRIDARPGTGAAAPVAGSPADGAGGVRDSSSAAFGGQAIRRTLDRPGTIGAPGAAATGRANVASSTADLFRSFLTVHDGPGASTMPPSLNHLEDADSSRQTLRRFLEGSTHDSDGSGMGSGVGSGMDLSAPPPLATAAIDMDELTDRVVRRIERRVVDELERRGRSGARRTF